MKVLWQKKKRNNIIQKLRIEMALC